jgi:hypothetical protein
MWRNVALGQKQTFAPQTGMSALPPKADMCGALAYVRFGPIADIRSPIGSARWQRFAVAVKLLDPMLEQSLG